MFRETVSSVTIINSESNPWSGHKKGSKIADFGHQQGKGFGKRAAHPKKFFWEYPSRALGLHSENVSQGQRGTCPTMFQLAQCYN